MSDDHDAPRYVNRDRPVAPEHVRDHVIYTCSDGETHCRLLAYEGSLGLKWRQPEDVDADDLPQGADPRLWQAVKTEPDAAETVKARIKAVFRDAIFGKEGNPSLLWVKTAVHPSRIEALVDVVDVVVARYQEDEAHL